MEYRRTIPSFTKIKGLLVLFLLFSFSTIKADYINLIQADLCETIIEIYIEDGAIRAQLEIGEEDYKWFSDVIPAAYFEGGYEGEVDAARLSHFLNNQFVIKADSRILKGKIELIEQRNRIPRASLYTGIADSTLMNKKIVYVEVSYELKKSSARIDIVPPIQEGYTTTMANIGFIVYHNTIPVNDLRYLSTEVTLFLNWEDPWYSYFTNKNISRHHSSSFMSFLYVEPYEVRHEILGRIKDFDYWIDLDYEMDDVISVEEQDSIKQLIADFLVKRNIVEVDGDQPLPIIDRVHFIEVKLSGIQIMEIPKPLPYSSAIIGIIFAFPNEGMPQEVKVNWDMFNDRINMIPSVSVDPAGPLPYDLQPDDDVLIWTNYLKNYQLPTVTEQKVEQASIFLPPITFAFIVLIVLLLSRSGWNFKHLKKWQRTLVIVLIPLAVLVYPFGFEAVIPFMKKRSYAEPEAKQLIDQLLKNTYRAFDFREEGDIYDKLALCNDDQLLQRIYLDTRKSMVIENQGGIEAKVSEITLKEVNEISEVDEGMGYQCNWIVKGEVGHWGHKHQRVNEYNAIIKIRSVDGVWKMYDLEIIEEKRI